MTTLSLPATIASPTRFLREAVTIKSDMYLYRDSHDWITKAPGVPSLAKRIKKWYREMLVRETAAVNGMITLPDEFSSLEMGVLGQLINEHSTVGEYELWEKDSYPESELGTYGDRQSCFVGLQRDDYCECRHMLNDDARHSWVFAESDDGYKSRCIMLTSDDYEGYFLTNAYGNLSLSDFARLLAKRDQTKCCKAHGIRANIYMNGDVWYIGTELHQNDDDDLVDSDGDRVSIYIDVYPATCVSCGVEISYGEDCHEDDHELHCDCCGVKCHDCGGHHDEEDMVNIGGDYGEARLVCESCLGEYDYCVDCCSWYDSGDIVNELCSDCGTDCAVCEDRHPCDDVEEVKDGSDVCEDCRNSYYTECVECGELIDDDDIDENDRCEDCVPRCAVCSGQHEELKDDICDSCGIDCKRCETRTNKHDLVDGHCFVCRFHEAEKARLAQ